jgi:hypothetical protein
MGLTKVTGSGANGLTLSSTDVTIGSGNLIFGTANKGVHLGVTSATASNLLDDYEEGTFTTTWTYDTDKTDTSPDETFSHTGNTYRKVGRLLFFNIKYINRAGTFGGSDAIISTFTLPFTNVTNVRSCNGGIQQYFLTGRYGSTHVTSGLYSTFNGTENTATFQVYLSAANGGNYFPSFEDGYNVGSLYCSGITFTE